MYENIGEKIKTVAKVACWIGIVFCIISGIYFLFNHVYIAGFFWLTAGPILSWVGTFVLYGFGELIVGVTNIEYKINLLAEPTNQSESVLSRLIKNSTTLQTDKQQGWKCQCGRINPLFVGTCACGKNKENIQIIKPATRRTITCPECGSVEDASHSQCYKCGAILK